ncbi:MAG: penicillin acylase family protein [Chloroflexi bacterium]|nr:MAG: penicillin acylase family protein [Chloroflexota bacterium]
MSRWRRAGIATGVVAVLLVASLVLTGLILVYRPLPTIDGESRLLGLEERAEVLRDGFGVPHIYAQTSHDLFYLQGYVTAQDRLFQMDLYRRAGAGRLAEVLGEPALDSDKQFRTYGVARVAAQEVTLLSEDTRANLNAYAEGVNKFLEGHGESLPLEFVILGYRPERWSLTDSIVVAKLQAYDAANNLDQELLRAGLASRFGTGVLATLMPDPSGRPVSVDERAWDTVAPYVSASSRFDGVAALSLPGAGDGTGSNCWALAGSRTATGKPILAGDPHLAVRNPSIWYEIGLEGAGYKLVGFSFAGIPGIVIGHNDRIAWSLTYAYTDTQDLFVERQDPSDPRRYEYKGQFEAATVVRESIAVKARPDPVIVDVAITRHGPIITPILEGQTAPLALRWTALDPGRLLDFIFKLARAGSWQEFRAAAADFSGAAVSACYADVDGHIGYQLIGQLPARKGDGQMPVPGWTGEYDWTGVVPFGANPTLVDPPAGVIVNANDRPTQDPHSAGYLGEWDPGFRAAYIAQRLAALGKAELADMRAIQTDYASTPVARWRDAIIAASPKTDLQRRAQALVRDWDGTLSAGSGAAAVAEVWLVSMLSRTFEEKIGEKLYADYLGHGRAVFALYQLLAHPDDPWFSDVGASAVRGRDAVSTLALEDATRDLVSRFGSDPAKWRWGDFHTITFAHPLAIGPLALLLNVGPFARSGDGFSVNNGGYDPAKPYKQTTNASERMIADLADLDRSLSVTPVGESGQPGSRYWGDQAPLWNAGEYKPMRFSKDRLGRIDGMLVFRPR